jgi:hypothetical protein
MHSSRLALIKHACCGKLVGELHWQYSVEANVGLLLYQGSSPCEHLTSGLLFSQFHQPIFPDACSVLHTTL